MANVNAPCGFRPYGDLKSVGIYSAGGTIYPGDAVEAAVGTSSTSIRRMEVVAANSGPLLGVALNYAVAGGIVRVADAPMQLFLGTSTSSATEFDNADDLGLNNIIVATAGNATYKCSRMGIGGGAATTAALEVKVIGLEDRADGKNEFGAYTRVIFKINNHQLSAATGTAGV